MLMQHCFPIGICHALIITPSNVLRRLFKTSDFFCFNHTHVLLSFLCPPCHNRCHQIAQSQMCQCPNNID